MELKRDSWTAGDYGELMEYLKSLADGGYKKFSDSLVPGENQSLGVRVPELRKISKEIAKGNYEEFLGLEKGDFREEIMLEGLVMSLIKCPYPEMLAYIKSYTEKITSWETCDIVSFKQIKKYLPEFFADIEYFIYSENPWAVRFGLGCLMEFYLTDEYIDAVLKYTNSVHSDFYYIQMMQAWLLATAAAKQRDKTMAFLTDNDLSDTVMNMTVRKMRESYRISAEDKERAKNFKRQR